MLIFHHYNLGYFMGEWKIRLAKLDDLAQPLWR